MKKKRLFILLFLFLFLVILGITYVNKFPDLILGERKVVDLFSSSPSPKITPLAVSPEPVSTEPFEEFEIHDRVRPPSSRTYYHVFLEGKKELGFSPDIDLCKKVLYQIEKEYVEEVNPLLLYKGARDEVKMLLAEAGVKKDGINSIPLTRDIFQNLVERYSDSVDKDLLLFACINGMMDALDDEHSCFLTPDEYREFLSQTREEKYCGIGVKIARSNPQSPVEILEVFRGGPAFQAGIRSGDMIVRVDKKDVTKLTVKEVADLMMGEENTRVMITVIRDETEIVFNLKRKKISVPAIHARMLDNGIGYIKIESFKQELKDEFNLAYNDLERQGVKALILDLRNNPGGLVTSAQSLCGFFLPQNTVISVFRHKNDGKRVIRTTGRKIVFVPVVVLVNEHSASSSEITAGALKDHRAAIIMGNTTRGKGSVQRTTPLKDACAVKITIEKIYTPDGFLIDKFGVKPHISVNTDPFEDKPTQEDVYLRIAVDYLRKKLDPGQTSTCEDNPENSSRENHRQLLMPAN